MTKTRLKGDRYYTKEKRGKVYAFLHIKEKFYLLLCILSVFAAKDNSFLCVLPIVLMQLCKDKITMCLCGGVSVVFYILTLLQGAFYVPCTTFVIVYLAGDYMLQQNKIKPVWFGAAVFAACKLYVLSFGYQPVYYMVFIAETAALLLLPDFISEGFRLVKASAEYFSPIQLFEAAAALLTVAVAISGLNVYGFNMSVWFLFSAAMYFELKDSIPLSLTAFLCMSVMVCQDRDFSFLFAGFLAIYLGGSAMIKQGSKGLVSTALLAAVVSVLFITRFNSFVFLTTTAASVAAAFAADRYLPVSAKQNTIQTEGERDYLRLTQQLDKLNRCFNFLGHTVIDISNLINKKDIPKDIADMVAQKHCRSCKNSTVCWQENYSHTQKQFSGYAHSLQNGKSGNFDSLFTSRCGKTQQLQQEFLQLYQLENTRQLISRSGAHNQKILQNQFLTMASILQEITWQAGRMGVANSVFTHRLNSWLVTADIKAEYAVCYQNSSKCVVAAKDDIDEIQLEKMRIKLESIYGEKFASGVKTALQTENIYTFMAVPKYKAEFGTHSKSRYTVCGDICEFFENEGCAYVILADGMGTGSLAAAESRTAVTMLKSLFSSGVKPETAIEITNTALNLKGTGQSCVAVDVLVADCYSGSCTLYKAGGAQGVLFDKGRAARLYRDSLPIGILKETKTAQMDFCLENGGSVLLLSDGITATEELLCKAQLMAEKLTAQQLSQLVVDSGADSDDATAAVLKFVRR